MSQPSDPPAEPNSRLASPRTVQKRLILSVAAALLATATVLSAVLLLVNRADWWMGFLAAATASVLAAIASLVPLLWAAGRSLNVIVAAYFAGTAARLLISLGACLLAIWAGGYPAAATLLLMAPFYFSVLAAESSVVARSLWNIRT